ncbi:MAG: histidine phosphatase family protein, partial [Dehalococcoidia bacterium]
MTRLILVRHGETDWNVTGRAQGHRDEPLNERGL